MRFGEKLKELRKQRTMTQTELAEMLGVTTRTIQNYENGRLYPKNSEIFGKLSSLFGVTADYLLDDSDFSLPEAIKKNKPATKRDIDRLISNVSGLFAGGSVSEEDKDRVIAALTKAYWDSKQLNARKKNK